MVGGPPKPPKPLAAETEPKRILTKEEVLEAIGKHVEGYTIERELSDVDGIYLLEVRGVKRDDGFEEYAYKRKTKMAQIQATSVTTIQVLRYAADGIPYGGDTLANYDERTGKWEPVL